MDQPLAHFSRDPQLCRHRNAEVQLLDAHRSTINTACLRSKAIAVLCWSGWLRAGYLILNPRSQFPACVRICLMSMQSTTDDDCFLSAFHLRFEGVTISRVLDAGMTSHLPRAQNGQCANLLSCCADLPIAISGSRSCIYLLVPTCPGWWCR